MGRDRLRRGYSLEVIFEEDSDFCSQLDSLDAVPFGYSTDSNNNTTKYLLRSHKRDFSVIELFGVSTSASCDNWDSPNDDENTEDTPSPPHSNSNYSNPNYSNPNYSNPVTELGRKPETTSLDQLLDVEGKSMDTCYINWDDEFSLNSLNKLKFQDCQSQREVRDMRELSPSSDSHTSSGRRSRVSRRQIVEANWIVNENDDEVNFEYATLNTNMNIMNRQSRNITKSMGKKVTGYSPNGYEYYTMDPRILIIDAPSQNKTGMTDMTFLHKTSHTKLQNSRSSVTMNFKSDEDSPLHFTSTFSLSKIEDADYNLSSESRSTSASSSSTDVKRVRAIFENGKIISTTSEDEKSNNPNPTPVLRFNKRNHHHSNSVKSKLEKKISAGSNNSISNGSPTSLRSTYSPISLGQMERYDLVDLLVNDNIIIEDSPDLFQTLRHARNRSEKKDWGSRSNLFTKGDSPSPKSTLRRSKSVGTGIHILEREMNQSEIQNELSKSRPSIIAEELPARNTVRNVRSVFEQILQQTSESLIIPTASDVRTSASTGNSNGKDRSIEEKSIFNKKALSSIKSNPTSKIFRSDSTRDEMDGGKGRYGTSILLKVNSKKSQEDPHLSTNQKLKTKIEKLHFIIEERPKEKHPLDDDTFSTTTSNGTIDENEEPKLISPDILHRIRSLGTTTTYFGGEILSKTIRNQKCAVTKRSLTQDDDYTDESVVDGNYRKSSPQQLQMDEFYFSVKPGRGGSPDRQRPLHLPLESFYKTSRPHLDTAPRIISVLPKSSSNSPTKSNSPVGSFLEERNSPEGCESTLDHQVNSEEGWINTDDSKHKSPLVSTDDSQSESREKGDGNNNGALTEINSKKFSEAAEGVWF